MPASVPQAARVYTVAELNETIHELLEASFGEVWVEGEISNCRAYPSGHTYFTLKDAQAQISAVLFKGAAWGLKFKPADGLKVLARGRVSSYVKRGDVQLVVSSLEPREKGALQLAFEQLKARLEKEGLFDAARKRPLPPYPERVGVVTSLHGAAIRDILSVLRRRWSGLEILIHPVAVQGDAAKDEIAAAIEAFNRDFPQTDVLLVGRGGGSLEDLWAFNEEVVARAIAASRIPVISCVGHETDFTIADFVADQRAPTPSAAAELAVPDRRAVLSEIAGSYDGMLSCLRRKLQRLEERLAAAARHPLLQSPRRVYEERSRRVDELAARLAELIGQKLIHATKDLALQAQRLDAFSPLKVLARGYAIAEKADTRQIVRSSRQAKPGELLRLRLREGSLLCEVKSDENR